MRPSLVGSCLTAALVLVTACDPGPEEVEEVEFPREPAAVTPERPGEEPRVDPVPIDTIRDDPVDPDRVHPDHVTRPAPDTLPPDPR